MAGPVTEIANIIHAEKHRLPGESFEEYASRVASALKDDDQHYHTFREILLDQRFAPGGRIQAAAGSARETTLANCFVIPVEDSFTSGIGTSEFFENNSIMAAATEAVQTMRMGGGVGYNFGKLRPRGDMIKSLQAKASGPLEMMKIFDACCAAIQSAGHRRGAQMGMLPVDHPDIEEFVHAKQNTNMLTKFNISVAVTDEFMRAVIHDRPFDLTFEGRVYKTISARNLWEEIMRSNWDWAEPGVVFIDQINRMNNLYWIENLDATNPCSEQPLPPYGACLLGSFNLTKYLMKVGQNGSLDWHYEFNYAQLSTDIPPVVRAMDNVNDVSKWPLDKQREEAHNKRRLGIGIMGLANVCEALGFPYGSDGAVEFTDELMRYLKNEVYLSSAQLAAEKGPFPLYDRDKYLAGRYVAGLDDDVRAEIAEHGIRNSHLISIAPTGTIALGCDNVSGGIEPPFNLGYTRLVQDFDGEREYRIQDWAWRELGIAGVTSEQCSAEGHIRMLCAVQRHVDSAVSKTCNIDPSMAWGDFKNLYMEAWEQGAKGCAIFNPGGKRMGILRSEGAACTIDPETGERSCE